MPFLGGGGSSGPVPAPPSGSSPGEFFTPPNQAGAAGSYTNLLNNLLGQYTGGSTAPQQQYPGASANAATINDLTAPGAEFSQILQQIASNPYYSGAQNAANNAASTISGQSGLLANDYNSAIMSGFGGQLAQAGNIGDAASHVYPLASDISNLAPSATALSGNTASLGSILGGLSGQASGQIPGINAAASRLGGLSQGLMPAGQPLVNDISALAARPEGVGSLQSGAQNVLGASQDLYNRPAGAGKLMGAGQNILDQGAALAAAPAGAGKLMQASTNLLNTGNDPQGALQRQLTQQTLDQSNAVNAMSGLSSSPYGAGLTNDALSNFNINWQNQQLGRQESALSGATAGFEGAGQLRQGRQNLLTNAAGAAGNAFGEASNLRSAREGLLTGGLDAASGAYGQAGNLLANKAGMYGQALTGTEGLYGGAGNLATAGANALAQGAGVAGTAGGLTSAQGSLNTQAANQLGTAGSLYGGGISGLGAGAGMQGLSSNIYGQLPGTANAATAGVGSLANMINAGGAMPGQAFTGQQQSETTALNNWINALNQAQSGATSASNIGLSANALPETLLSDLGNYLKLGQNASLGSGQLGLMNQQQSQPDLAGIGSLAMGSGLGGLAFGSGGLGGTLGLGSGGLAGAGLNALGLGPTSAPDQALLDAFTPQGAGGVGGLIDLGSLFL